VSFPVLDRRELVAGKVKALMERTASRDLYDLARIAALNPNAMDDPLLRALAIRAISTADPFPAVQDPVEALSKFAEPTDELVESLRAVVAADDKPDFPAMCDRGLLSWRRAPRSPAPSASTSACSTRSPTADRSSCCQPGPTCSSAR
jgi:hypothetical protein